MRWLFVKDLQILRRSPLLVGLLIVYPVVIALMIGFALSSPPGKPKVAFFSEVAPGKGKIQLGSQQINVSSYASELFKSIQPIRVHSRGEAIAKVKDGEASAALIVPSDIVSQIQSVVTTGVGSPTVELILNSKDPLDRQFAQQAISSRLNQVDQYEDKRGHTWRSRITMSRIGCLRDTVLITQAMILVFFRCCNQMLTRQPVVWI